VNKTVHQGREEFLKSGENSLQTLQGKSFYASANQQ